MFALFVAVQRSNVGVAQPNSRPFGRGGYELTNQRSDLLTRFITSFVDRHFERLFFRVYTRPQQAEPLRYQSLMPQNI